VKTAQCFTDRVIQANVEGGWNVMISKNSSILKCVYEINVRTPTKILSSNVKSINNWEI